MLQGLEIDSRTLKNSILVSSLSTFSKLICFNGKHCGVFFSSLKFTFDFLLRYSILTVKKLHDPKKKLHEKTFKLENCRLGRRRGEEKPAQFADLTVAMTFPSNSGSTSVSLHISSWMIGLSSSSQRVLKKNLFSEN